MIKRIKEVPTNAFLSQETYRDYIESFESETIRGIATLIILRIIKDHGAQGSYGYQILKELKERTSDMLIIEEGRLYPLLRKLEKWGPDGEEISLVESKNVEESNRIRKYYRISKAGLAIFPILEGIFYKIMESVAPILDFQVNIPKPLYFFCPNCANKLLRAEKSIHYCEMCGYNLDEYRKNLGGKASE